MRIYKNVTVDCDNKSDREIFEAVKSELARLYPELTGENLTIVATLMAEHDEDVNEDYGQFSCYSSNASFLRSAE